VREGRVFAARLGGIFVISGDIELFHVTRLLATFRCPNFRALGLTLERNTLQKQQYIIMNQFKILLCLLGQAESQA